MINRRLKPRIIFLFLGEGLILFAGIYIAAWIRFDFIWARVVAEGTLVKAVLITAVCQLTLYYCDVYDLKGRRSLSETFLDFFRGMGIAYILLAFIYYLVPELVIGRGIGMISFVLILLFLTLWRSLYDRFLTDPEMRESFIILGTGNLAQSIAREVLSDPGLGVKIEGFLSAEEREVGQSLVNPKVLGTYHQVHDIVQERNISGIVVALNERRGNFPVSEILKCKFEGIKVADGTAFLEEISGKISVEDLRPSWIIFSDGFRKNRWILRFKSVSDVVFALCGLVVSLPVMLCVAAAIRLDSAGPVLYRQTRVGRGGRRFNVLKFRSMRTNAEVNGPQWASRHDPRITRVGRVIRKYRLDELPQLINILKGEMSFVGPRPERPEFIPELRKEIPYYDERHTVKPGVTGWAQVKFSYGNTIEDALEKLQYDLFYVKNIGLMLDLMIIFRTIKVVVFGRGAL